MLTTKNQVSRQDQCSRTEEQGPRLLAVQVTLVISTQFGPVHRCVAAEVRINTNFSCMLNRGRLSHSREGSTANWSRCFPYFLKVQFASKVEAPKCEQSQHILSGESFHSASLYTTSLIPKDLKKREFHIEHVSNEPCEDSNIPSEHTQAARMTISAVSTHPRCSQHLKPRPAAVPLSRAAPRLAFRARLTNRLPSLVSLRAARTLVAAWRRQQMRASARTRRSCAECTARAAARSKTAGSSRPSVGLRRGAHACSSIAARSNLRGDSRGRKPSSALGSEALWPRRRRRAAGNDDSERASARLQLRVRIIRNNAYVCAFVRTSYVRVYFCACA
eukprot:6211430-Pleurochrysis_carterae.AAC.2